MQDVKNEEGVDFNYLVKNCEQFIRDKNFSWLRKNFIQLKNMKERKEYTSNILNKIFNNKDPIDSLYNSYELVGIQEGLESLIEELKSSEYGFKDALMTRVYTELYFLENKKGDKDVKKQEGYLEGAIESCKESTSTKKSNNSEIRIRVHNIMNKINLQNLYLLKSNFKQDCDEKVDYLKKSISQGANVLEALNDFFLINESDKMPKIKISYDSLEEIFYSIETQKEIMNYQLSFFDFYKNNIKLPKNSSDNPISNNLIVGLLILNYSSYIFKGALKIIEQYLKNGKISVTGTFFEMQQIENYFNEIKIKNEEFEELKIDIWAKTKHNFEESKRVLNEKINFYKSKQDEVIEKKLKFFKTLKDYFYKTIGLLEYCAKKE
jgi:hypothetical protein